jgi:transposase
VKCSERLEAMRGGDQIQSGMFSYLSPETRVRKEHPLRAIRVMVDRALREMTPLFDQMYSQMGRPSIAPEKLLRAQLLQMLYSVRSERLLMEEIDYSVLFRWFVGMNLDEPVWDPTVFTKNRDRLLEHEVAKVFFAQVWNQAEQANLTSDEHFTVDGTLLEAGASLKSFQKKGTTRHDDPDDPGNPTVNFHGESRSNDTHESTTDPDAKLARKGTGREAKLSYCGNLLIENSNGADRKHRVAAGQRDSGAGCGVADDRADPCCAAGNGGSRQGLRHQRICSRVPPDERNTARLAEHQSTRRKRHRCPNHPPRWLQN